MLGKIQYEFSAQTWQHAAPGGWYFVNLPVDVSSEIRAHFKWLEEGWGRLKVLAKLVQANGNLLFGSTRNAPVIYFH